ncbi:MAG: hypothetical protein LQ346_007411 [Caloplaca aetnensis]|nr:MAG: hypothetical protein LQ346_007411 [Caloplaca aetnensis]
MYGFLMVAQIAAVTSSKKQRAMLPFMTEEKERIKSMLSRCVAENRYPDTAYLEDAHDNMSLTRAIFQLSLSLGDNICFDGKKAILYNIDVNVGAQTVKFHLLMEGEEPAYPTKDFADIIGPSRGYDLEASYEHKTLDEKASKRKELKEEQSGAKEPEAEPEDIVEQFEKVDLAADEAKTDGHNVL